MYSALQKFRNALGFINPYSFIIMSDMSLKQLWWLITWFNLAYVYFFEDYWVKSPLLLYWLIDS